MDQSALLTSLLALASTDGRIGKRELSYIVLVMREYDVSFDAITQLYESMKGQRIFPQVPGSVTDQNLLLHLMIKLAAVDGVIDPAEKIMIESVAFRSQWTPERLDKALGEALAKRQSRDAGLNDSND